MYQSIQDKINYIVTECENLRIKYLPYESLKLFYVCIMSQSSDKYDSYKKELLKLGDTIDEKETGIRVKIKEPIVVNDLQVTEIKVRKPEKGKSQIGYVDYRSENYDKFKSKVIESKYFETVLLPNGIELIKLEDKAFDVLIYFPNLPNK